jgi:hypothetical protein
MITIDDQGVMHVENPAIGIGYDEATDGLMCAIASNPDQKPTADQIAYAIAVAIRTASTLTGEPPERMLRLTAEFVLEMSDTHMKSINDTRKVSS